MGWGYQSALWTAGMELEVHLNFIIKISDYNFMRVDFFIMVFQLHNWAEKSGEARKIIAGKM